MITKPNYVDQYNCNGSQIDFYITIDYLKQASNIKVTYFTASDSADHVLVEGTNYSVDTVNDKITIISTATYPSPYPTGDKITISLDMDYKQETDITSNSNYDPEVLETAYDNNTLLARQNKENIDRTVKLSITDSGSDMTLPPIDNLKNGVLGFDENGNPEAHPGFIPRAYDPSYAYSVDDIIQYNGIFYKCLVAHTNQIPGGAGNIYWRNKNFDGITYQSDLYYFTGEIVSYNGDLFKSLIDDNNVTPTKTYPDTNWEQLPIDLTYAPTGNYMTGDYTVINGLMYKSLVDNNKGNSSPPTYGDTDWERIFTKGDTGEINPYDSATSYSVDTVVSYSQKMYISKLGGNQGNQPDISPTYWKEWPEITTDNRIYSYDISASDQTHTLDAITSIMQIIDILWSGGDGTYKLTINDNGGTSIGYEGEGEGHIKLISDGSAWKVVGYEDRLYDTATGIDTRKLLDGTQIATGKLTTVSDGSLAAITSTKLTLPQ